MSRAEYYRALLAAAEGSAELLDGAAAEEPATSALWAALNEGASALRGLARQYQKLAELAQANEGP